MRPKLYSKEGKNIIRLQSMQDSSLGLINNQTPAILIQRVYPNISHKPSVSIGPFVYPFVVLFCCLTAAH